ncbi:hypothetical protein B0H14DRAFT_2643328 [Mycena olivaceomarginata]|nr:hypothetical protein B0H14DRAFT_2643328 [Mycena olivaceomarginata]
MISTPLCSVSAPQPASHIMNEQHPFDTSAPTDQLLLTHLASTTNMQHPLINLAPAPLNVNELNPVNIQAQAAIKPLRLDFPKHHMESSLSLLSVEELSQAACKSPSPCQVNRKGTDYVDFLKLMICDLGPRAEHSGTVLEKINEHTKDGIHIHHSKNSRTPTIYGDEFGNLATFIRGTPAASIRNFPGSADIHLALLSTSIEPTKGVSHINQLSRPTHTVIVGIVHTCDPTSRALLVWDANILRTELNKTKESLHASTRDTLRRARSNNRCPNFQTFWINKGQKGNHDNIYLELTLKEILRIASEGLSIRKGEDGVVQKVQGFIKVDDN